MRGEMFDLEADRWLNSVQGWAEQEYDCEIELEPTRYGAEVYGLINGEWEFLTEVEPNEDYAEQAVRY